jgi:ketosteroid isomerase-like protein
MPAENPMSKRSRQQRKEAAAAREVGSDRAQPAVGGSGRAMTRLAAPVAVVTSLIAVGLLCVVVYQSRAEGPTRPKPDDPRQAGVEEMVRRYFRTWSNQDMKGYGECFHPKGTVQFVDSQGQIDSFAAPAFVDYQARLVRTNNPQTETPESIEITFEGKLCRAVVFWKLKGGGREVTGYDHFTLTQQNGKWKIVNLVYYESDRVP